VNRMSTLPIADDISGIPMAKLPDEALAPG
jgi:hypothetical protein